MTRVLAGLFAFACGLSAAAPANSASLFDRWERRAERYVAQRVIPTLGRRGEWLYYNGYRGLADFKPGHRLFRGYWFPSAAFTEGGIATSAVGPSDR